jgi:hypothetical protein
VVLFSSLLERAGGMFLLSFTFIPGGKLLLSVHTPAQQLLWEPLSRGQGFGILLIHDLPEP